MVAGMGRVWAVTVVQAVTVVGQVMAEAEVAVVVWEVKKVVWVVMVVKATMEVVQVGPQRLSHKWRLGQTRKKMKYSKARLIDYAVDMPEVPYSQKYHSHCCFDERFHVYSWCKFT